ncbi:SET domain-containing protein [Marasmius fiardii PR-910]|nr:SET domain-containing protein [Marasmius fiardii PR-910]
MTPRNSYLSPKCYWSTDLPHAFHDHINWLSEDHRNNNQMRHILESIIIENTSEEPHAPPISIKNQIDSTPTPQWEFYYTNKMWHSPSVPAPSVKRLGSCGCIGKCRADTCACAKRQKKYTEDYTQEGFVYDKQRCDDDCVNRVVQNGRKVEVSLFKTAKKGWGVVNGGKKIPKGQFIGVYSGEYLTQDEAETRGKVYNKFGRTYLFDCDLWIFTGGARYTIDAYHAGNFTRFLNHSCDPNAHFGYVYIDEDDIYKPLLCVFARRDIAPHEEITFSYTGDPDTGDDDDDGESSVKKRKAKKGPRAKKSDTVYSECHCGARKCKGFLFN